MKGEKKNPPTKTELLNKKIELLLNKFTHLNEGDTEYEKKYLEIYQQNKSEIDALDSQIAVLDEAVILALPKVNQAIVKLNLQKTAQRIKDVQKIPKTFFNDPQFGFGRNILHIIKPNTSPEIVKIIIELLERVYPKDQQGQYPEELKALLTHQDTGGGIYCCAFRP